MASGLAGRLNAYILAVLPHVGGVQMFHQTADKLPCQSIQGAFKDSITLSRVESVRALVAFLLIAEPVSVIHEINRERYVNELHLTHNKVTAIDLWV